MRTHVGWPRAGEHVGPSWARTGRRLRHWTSQRSQSHVLRRRVLVAPAAAVRGQSAHEAGESAAFWQRVCLLWKETLGINTEQYLGVTPQPPLPIAITISNCNTRRIRLSVPSSIRHGASPPNPYQRQIIFPIATAVAKHSTKIPTEGRINILSSAQRRGPIDTMASQTNSVWLRLMTISKLEIICD